MQIILFGLLPVTVFSQSASIFDVDTKFYPQISAKIFCIDDVGNQMEKELTDKLFLLDTSGNKTILSINFNKSYSISPVSVYFVIDLNDTLYGKNLELINAFAKKIPNLIPLGKSECFILKFTPLNNYFSMLIKNREDFHSEMANIKTIANSDENENFGNIVDRPAYTIRKAEKGHFKKIIIYFTDGYSSGEKEETLRLAKELNAKFFVFSMSSVQDYLKFISEKTNGKYLENLKSTETAVNYLCRILISEQGAEPFQVEWTEKGYSSVRTKKIFLEGTELSEDILFNIPCDKLPNLRIRPYGAVKFGKRSTGSSYFEKVTISALNDTVLISSITSNNNTIKISDFGGTPPPFALMGNEARTLTVEYTPKDSNFFYSNLTIESNACSGKNIYVSGGDIKLKSLNEALRIVFPNGRENLIAGSDTNIVWEGVSPDDFVKLEISTDAGKKWKIISNNARGLSYRWRVPMLESNAVAIRATLKSFPGTVGEDEVQIGSQIWMGKNLDVSTYKNGDSIRRCNTKKEWADAGMKSQGAYCYTGFDEAKNKIYGKLYNWFAVNDVRGLAPDGWHIPTDQEFQLLENYLGSNIQAGGKLKATGTVEELDGLWFKPNNGATNESGFTALPGGLCFDMGSFGFFGINGFWWSSTFDIKGNIYFLSLFNNESASYRKNHLSKTFGLSVRCIKD